MLERITLGGTEYYQWKINNEAGDIFTDWRDIPYYKQKLITQQNGN
jgi:hypothetical protein